MSLDMPKRSSLITHDHSLEKQIMKENKKYKQPSSPGARLASFLNSLFNQKSPKKKPKSSGKINDLEDENPGGIGRKRRSSLVHFLVTNVLQVLAQIGRPVFQPRILVLLHLMLKPPQNHAKNLSRVTTQAWCCKKLSYIMIKEAQIMPGSMRDSASEMGFPRTLRNGSTFEFSGHGRRFATTWGFHGSSSEGRKISKFSDPDDHSTESDSSSNLFDLLNYGSNFCSRTGLPVYETTNLDRIKRSSLIVNAATVSSNLTILFRFWLHHIYIG